MMARVPKPLLAVSSLLLVTSACVAVSRLFQAQEVPAATSQPATLAPSTDVVGTEEAPGSEPTQVRRLELPPTPTSFALASDEDVRSVLDLSRPDVFDYFDDPVTWFDYDAEGRAAYEFQEGHLLGTDYEPEERFTWWSYSDTKSGNLYVEVSTTNGNCIGKDGVGLAIRVDPDMAAGGYSLEIACDGHWRFRRHGIGSSPTEMVGWTASEVVNTGAGATNRLGIWAYQKRFVLFINGQPVGEVFDPNYTYSYGRFALFVRASQTYDLTATFDDFALWHIDFLP
jgi:hypothetical protein